MLCISIKQYAKTLKSPHTKINHTMAPLTFFETLSSTASNGQIVDSDTGLIIMMLFFGGLIFIGIVIITLARRK